MLRRAIDVSVESGDSDDGGEAEDDDKADEVEEEEEEEDDGERVDGNEAGGSGKPANNSSN